MLYKRFLCTQAAAFSHHKWPIKQVTKSNFADELAQLKSQIFSSDFVAVSLQNTGGCSATWHRVLPIDTDETAYLKAKCAAERFQIFQFAVCPFSVKGSNLIAHPYNFHLFPRDELRVGMPSYSFSCQPSYLSSMAREGFDFNACIYNGISFLSRTQESSRKVQMGHLSRSSYMVQSSPAHSVADSIFMERIKSRVKGWVNACKTSDKTEDTLISSLKKLVSGSELYGSRPCLTIDVISERQVELTLETLKEFADVVPLRDAVKRGGVQAVRIVLTSSEEDKNLFEKELQHAEEEQNKRIRGFREVIDLISSSQKPVVAHNSLNDFAFIYSKFLSSLPPTEDEFRSSLLSVFPIILDVNHLMKEVGPFKKIRNISATISYLKGRFFAPVDMDIPNRGEADNLNIHGHNVLEICQLFLKLCSILKINPEVFVGEHIQLSPSLQCHANIFSPPPGRSRDPNDEDVGIQTNSNNRVSTERLVFLWGFGGGISALKLREILHDSHEVLSENFDIQMVDKTCAVVVFWTPGFSERFLTMMESGNNISDKLKYLISEGLRATGYETYRRVCETGLWQSNLAECLDNALEETETLPGAKAQQEQPVIYWNNEDMINLDEL